MTTELWVALDVGSEAAVAPLVDALDGRADAFKVGAQLFTAVGPSIINRIKARGARVFLDLKYHDIPNTVGAAVRAATAHEVDYISVHASGGPEMLSAAVESAHDEAAKRSIAVPRILAITVLTSIDADGLRRHLHVTTDLPAYVDSLAQLAQRTNVDGIVASPQELGRLRAVCGPDFFVVTPGIRPAWAADAGDQRRIATPRFAAAAGASAVVVGRPIVASPDPRLAAEKTKAELSP